MNRREQEICKRYTRSKGWKVLKRGYPDFLVWNFREQKAVFLEVKSKTEKEQKDKGLSPEQQDMHCILRLMGHTVKVVYVD